jgi:hypothetical protein
VEGAALNVCNDTWYRFVFGDRGLAALVFYPTICFAETEFGTLLPYFVYGTLREGYKNHKRCLKDHGRRVGKFWKTRDPTALFVGEYPYLVETPPPDCSGARVTGEVLACALIIRIVLTFFVF